MVFLTESWFWRGTQSAIFYYVSCTPYVEYKHKKRRRREAHRSRKEKEVVFAQPGAVSQPAPFETNPAWVPEILEGPHPPKGWKRDPLYYEFAPKAKEAHLAKQSVTRSRAETGTSTASPAKSDWTATTGASTNVDHVQRPVDIHLRDLHLSEDTVTNSLNSPPEDYFRPNRQEFPDVTHNTHWHGRSSTAVDEETNALSAGAKDVRRSLDDSSSTPSKRTSFDAEDPESNVSRPTRPSMEKRLSTAMDGFKEAMRTAWHPDQWNWIRYDRDDEILSGLNEKVKTVWSSMRERMASYGEEANTRLRQAETQVSIESESQKWQRGVNPPINDMHPPIVSQLPISREAASWMLLPPASADVMMGKSRPDPFNDYNRKPLCVIGRREPVREIQQRSPSLESQVIRSDSEDREDAELETAGHELVPGFTHIQRPQLPHFWTKRSSSGF